MSKMNSQLLPLVIFLAILAGAGFVGYHIYLSALQMRQQAESRMAKKNVVFTKDGMRVGVKQLKQEKYVDQTQSWVVKAWNLSGGDATLAAAAANKKRS
jgi:hypothetical protein